jgi:predicted ATPase
VSNDERPHYLTVIDVEDALVVKSFKIEISNDPHELQHLILTGPNGSGKSSVLSGLWTALEPSHVGGPWRRVKHRSSIRSKLLGENYPLVRLWEPVTEGVVAYLDTARTIVAKPVMGPTPLDLARRRVGASRFFSQYLINRRTEQAYAREDGDEQTADRIAQWFKDFQMNLREIFADPRLTIVKDRQEFVYRIFFEGTRAVELEELPDGFSSILDIWAEIMMQEERFRQKRDAEPTCGFVFIDTPELHLHAELQEKILPFLTRLFPTFQFIITTHSPVIAASIGNATVFDLRTHERISSSELRGLRYGSIFTEWFGIPNDFDRHTAAELARLKLLAQSKPAPGTSEYAELKELADRLSGHSHLLAIAVNKQLEDHRD